MEIKEDNVYDKQTATEQAGAVCAQEGNGSAGLGKFKSVDALLQAYESLQAEFTRRSQRLKQLERETENRTGGQGEDAGAEKLRKLAEHRKAEEAEFDSFVAELEERAVSPVPETAEEEAGNGPFVAESREAQPLSSDMLYQKAVGDESVRLKIIGEYLSSLGKTGVPLMRGGAGTLVAPPVKPKSVEEAGSMALRFFKNDGVQA